MAKHLNQMEGWSESTEAVVQRCSVKRWYIGSFDLLLIFLVRGKTIKNLNKSKNKEKRRRKK